MNQHVQLGGFDANGRPGCVEVNETYYFRRKYHHGRGKWVIGIVERGTGCCWLERVAKRDAPTLERIIVDHVLPGTIVITDVWAGYSNVSSINNRVYQHKVVVHDQRFVHPVHLEINSQSIEGLWMHAKRKLRHQCGTNRSLCLTVIWQFYAIKLYTVMDVFIHCFLSSLLYNKHTNLGLAFGVLPGKHAVMCQ